VVFCCLCLNKAASLLQGLEMSNFRSNKPWWIFSLVLILPGVFIVLQQFSPEGNLAFSPPSPLTTAIKPSEKIVLPSPPKQLVMANVSAADKQNVSQSLWVILDDAKLSLPLSKRVTEKAVMRMDQNFLWSLQSGAEMQFTLPDGRRMLAIIDSVIVNPNQDKTLRAHIETNFGDYPFTYTMGKNAAGDAYGFGFVGLPEGRFTIEVSGQYGVVYRNPEPPRQVDPSKRDYVIPPAPTGPKPSTIKL
jgi:hypothetical protein